MCEDVFVDVERVLYSGLATRDWKFSQPITWSDGMPDPAMAVYKDAAGPFFPTSMGLLWPKVVRCTYGFPAWGNNAWKLDPVPVHQTFLPYVPLVPQSGPITVP